MAMFKKLVLTSALLAAGAVSAQEAAITGKEFLSGAGDAKMAEIAREAAASGKVVVITAPKYWQEKAAAKVHAGSPKVAVHLSEGFFENVLVRVEDAKAPKPVEVAPKAEPIVRKAEPKPEKPVAVAPRPAPVERVVPPPVPVETPKVETAKVIAPPPAPVKAITPPVPAPVAKPAPVDPAIAIKQRFEQNLNGGKAAEGSLPVSQLQKDDTIFVDGTVRAVVRRFGPRTQLYWLEGELNLERAELVVSGPDRYKVSEPIRDVANPTLRGTANAVAQKFTGNVPAPSSATRTNLQKQFADGRDVAESLAPAGLRHGDVIHVGQGSALVVRRTGTGFERYWIVGELDLHQSGLQQQGGAYLVLTDTIK